MPRRRRFGDDTQLAAAGAAQADPEGRPFASTCDEACAERYVWWWLGLILFLALLLRPNS